MTLNRTSEVASLLSKRNLMKSPYFIKPDLTPPKRHMEAALLKQHWSFINTGLNRSYIKMRGQCIFVKGQLHAKYQDHQLDFSNPFIDSINLKSNFHQYSKPQFLLVSLTTLLLWALPHLQKIFPLLQPLPLQWISHDYLQICTFNALSSVNKHALFQSFVSSSSYKTICISKSWLTNFT